MALKITSNDSGFGNHISYKAIVDDATGIYSKSTIRVAGINAGNITNIQLSDGKALIEFDIMEEIKMTADSVLKIKSVGLLGDKYLDIQLGNPGLERLPKNSFVQTNTGGGFETLGKDAGEVLGHVKEIAVTIKEALRKDGKNVVKETLDNIYKVSSSLKNVIQANETKLNQTLENVRKISAQLAFETGRNNSESLMAYLTNLKPILEDTKVTMANLKIVMSDVKDGKGTIGKLLRDEEVVDKVSSTLSSVNKLVSRINNIEAKIALFTGVNSDHGNHTQFDVDLYPAPERFFRLGVVTNQFGPEVDTETETTTTVAGSTVVENKREVRKNAIKFNAMIGRRLGNWAFRAGLIETTGGIGIDYHIPNHNLLFTGEAFDYQEEIGPYVRLSAEYRLWNMFYAKLSGEDLVSKGDNQSFTISAGLRFNDQDLAALIGLVAR